MIGIVIGYDPGGDEKHMEDWAQRDFGRLIKYCKIAGALPDVPFSMRYT